MALGGARLGSLTFGRPEPTMRRVTACEFHRIIAALSTSPYQPIRQCTSSPPSRFITRKPTSSRSSPRCSRYAGDVLVVDDGSTDRTPELLRAFPTVRTIRHPRNLGYGAGLRTAFRAAVEQGLRRAGDARLRRPARAVADPRAWRPGWRDADIVSGSRYLEVFDPAQRPPEERRRINVEVTRWLNECLGLNLTDAFCGFKAYRTSALEQFDITDDGYAMPLQVWVQAAARGMTIEEVAVPLIYLDESRAFGGSLDDAELSAGPLPRGVPGGARSGRTGHRGGVSGMTARRLRAPATDGGLLVEPAAGARSAASPRPTPIGSRAGITTSRAGGPTRLRARPAARSSSSPASSSAATAWLMSPAPSDRPTGRRPAHRDRPPARAVPSGRLGQELRGVGDRPIVRGPRPQPDRRQRYPQGLVHPRADHDRRRGSGRSPSSSTSGRARSPTRTGRSATSRCSRRSPIGSHAALGGADRRPAARRLLAAGDPPSRRGRRGRPAVLAGPPRDRGGVGRRQPRGPPGPALPDRELPLVRLAPDRPASPISSRSTTPAWPSIARPTISAAGTIPLPPCGARVIGWKRRSGSGGPTQPRRRPLLARQRGRTVELRIAGEDEVLASAAADPRRRGVLRRRAAPRPGRRLDPPAHPGPHDHHVRPLLPGRPVHPRHRRGEVR